MRVSLGWIALLLLAAGLAGGYVRGCAGPRPEVVSARAEPLGDGMRAVASVRNRGGEGQIQVDFRLVDRGSGQVYAHEASSPVRRGETTQVSTWIAAPPGDYQVEAEAEYPPR